MRAFFVTNSKGQINNINVANACIGFEKMGWETILFNSKIPQPWNPEDMMVATIPTIRDALMLMGITPPQELEYPDELSSLYGRRIWEDNLDRYANDPDSWNTFIKPKEGKKFDGRVVSSFKDLIACGSQLESVPIWVSDAVNIVAEWRCFVRYNTIVDARPYKGDWRSQFDHSVPERALALLKNKPAAFSIDIGVTANGQTIVIELNDGYSLGNYGLSSTEYAKLLSARWYELVGKPDPCYF